VHWAKSFLAKAGLIELTGRGRFRITDEGKRVLASPPERIDNRFLQTLRPATRSEHEGTRGEGPAISIAELAPDETLREAQRRLESELAHELLDRILKSHFSFFERLVVRLLTGMGYGGSTKNAARALGKSGDDGVDGVIDQDPLGLDRIYVQAKLYRDNCVGPGEIREFFGALDRFKAAKGVFMTSSSFSNAARRTAEQLSKRIILIEGDELARMMIQYGVGCRIEDTIHIKKIDEEFFED
jgi:restriction system protein